jgi:hypothetical protein
VKLPDKTCSRRVELINDPVGSLKFGRGKGIHRTEGKEVENADKIDFDH